ncbi:MAG: hypothetical protein NTZ10_06025 [Candidatus Saganbacteria bacterium]|nr:hypothetical protein [Candidatus Saganbacteria bacterium]
MGIKIRITEQQFNRIRTCQNLIVPKDFVTRPLRQSSHPVFASASVMPQGRQMEELFRINGVPITGVAVNGIPDVTAVIARPGMEARLASTPFQAGTLKSGGWQEYLKKFPQQVQNAVDVCHKDKPLIVPLFSYPMIRDEEHFAITKEPSSMVGSLALANRNNPVARIFRNIPWGPVAVDLPACLEMPLLQLIRDHANGTNIGWPMICRPAATSTLLYYKDRNDTENIVPYQVNRALLEPVIKNVYTFSGTHEQCVTASDGSLLYRFENADGFKALPEELLPLYLPKDAKDIKLLVSPERVGDIPYLTVDLGPLFSRDPELEDGFIAGRLKFIFLVKGLHPAKPEEYNTRLPIRITGPFHFKGNVDFEMSIEKKQILLSGKRSAPDVYRLPHSWIGCLGLECGTKLKDQPIESLTIVKNDGTEAPADPDLLTCFPEILAEMPNPDFPRIVDARAHGGMVIAKYERDDGTTYWDWAPEETLLARGYSENRDIEGGLALIRYRYDIGGEQKIGTTAYPITKDSTSRLQRKMRSVLFNPVNAARVIEMVPSPDQMTLTAVAGKQLNPLSSQLIDPIYYSITPQTLYGRMSRINGHTIFPDGNKIIIHMEGCRIPVRVNSGDLIDNDNRPLYGNPLQPHITSPDDIYVPYSRGEWAQKFRPRIGRFLGWAPDKSPETAQDLSPENLMLQELKAMLYPVEKIDVGSPDLNSFLPQGAIIEGIAYMCPASSIQVEVGRDGKKHWIPLSEPLGRTDNINFSMGVHDVIESEAENDGQ